MWAYVYKCKRRVQYFITFIDDYSRYKYIYLMRHKSETFKKFKEFKLKWRTIVVRVSSLYDLIMEANTSWMNLGSS